MLTEQAMNGLPVCLREFRPVAVLPLGRLRLTNAVLNAVAICITMQSMLASNKKKERCVAAYSS
jgi:hypothetical protein